MLRSELRQAISRHIDERNLVVDTATANGDTKTLVCSRLSDYPSDEFRHGELVVSGVARRVLNNQGSTVTTHAFGSAISSGTAFELRKQRGPFFESINQSINEALIAVYNWTYIPISDATSVTYAAGTEEYAIPTSFQLLVDVEYETSGNGAGDWVALPATSWDVIQGAATLRLKELATGKLVDEQKLRLRGYRKPALLSADTDTTEVNANYVIAYAVGKLLGNFAGGPATDPDAHAQRQGFWTNLANVERVGVKTKRLQSARRVRW